MLIAKLDESKRIHYESKRLITGLTDVKITIWNTGNTKVVDEATLTELGDGIYYYDYVFSSIGEWIIKIDSDTQSRTAIEQVHVVDSLGGGGSGVSWDVIHNLRQISGSMTKINNIDKLATIIDGLVKNQKRFEQNIEKRISKISDAQEVKKNIDSVGSDIKTNLSKENTEFSKKIDALNTTLKKREEDLDNIKVSSMELQEDVKKQVREVKKQLLNSGVSEGTFKAKINNQLLNIESALLKLSEANTKISKFSQDSKNDYESKHNEIREDISTLRLELEAAKNSTGQLMNVIQHNTSEVSKFEASFEDINHFGETIKDFSNMLEHFRGIFGYFFQDKRGESRRTRRAERNGQISNIDNQLNTPQEEE